LNKDETQALLYEVDDEFAEIKKNAEKEQKEVVDEKVKELKDVINKGIDNEWGWTRVKKTLDKDIKNGLVELKNEIVKSETSTIAIHEQESYIVTSEQGEKMAEEIIKWRVLFGGKTPDEVAKTLGNKESSRKNVNELFDGIHERGERWTTESAEKLVPGWLQEMPVAKAGVGLITGVVSLGSGVAAIGIHEFDKTTEDIKGLVEKTGTELKEFSENMVKTGADTVENFRGGAEKLTGKAMDNAKDLIGQGMKTFDIAGTLTKGIGHAEEVKAEADRDARKVEAEAKARVEEAKAKVEQYKSKEAIEGLNKLLEEKEKQIKELKEEKEKEIKKLEDRIKKKDERIEKLEEKIEKLDEKVEKSQDRLLVAEIEVSRSRATSPTPGYNN